MSSLLTLPLLASLCLLPIACASSPADADPSFASNPGSDPAATASEQSASGRVSSHGMVVAGTPAQVFLSHIPLFSNPHDVQAIVSGRLVADAASPPLPSSFREQLFTYLPDRFSLDALRAGTLRELRGTLFLGNFESGGRPVASGVRFELSAVLHEHVLDAASAPASLTYFLFGSAERTYAVHRIAGSPSFDEVVPVRLDPELPSTVLAKGIEVQLPGPDASSNRLGLGGPAVSVSTTDGLTLTIAPSPALSCLVGPQFFTACDSSTPPPPSTGQSR